MAARSQCPLGDPRQVWRSIVDLIPEYGGAAKAQACIYGGYPPRHEVVCGGCCAALLSSRYPICHLFCLSTNAMPTH